MIAAAMAGLQLQNYSLQVQASEAVYGPVSAVFSPYDTRLPRSQYAWQQNYTGGWDNFEEFGLVWRASTSEVLIPPQNEALTEDSYVSRVKHLIQNNRGEIDKDALERVANTFLLVRDNAIAYDLLKKMVLTDRIVCKKVLVLLTCQGLADEMHLIQFATLFTDSGGGGGYSAYTEYGKASETLCSTPEGNLKWFTDYTKWTFTAAESFGYHEALEVMVCEKVRNGISGQGPGCFATWSLGVLYQFMGRCRERMFRATEDCHLPAGLSWLNIDQTYEPNDVLLAKVAVLLEEVATVAEGQEVMRLQRRKLLAMQKDQIALHVVPCIIFMITAHDEPSVGLNVPYHPECRSVCWLVKHGLKYMEEIIPQRKATYKGKIVGTVNKHGNGPYDGPGKDGAGGGGAAGNAGGNHEYGPGAAPRKNKPRGGPYKNAWQGNGKEGYQYGDSYQQEEEDEKQDKHKWYWDYKSNKWKQHSAANTSNNTRKRDKELDHHDEHQLTTCAQVEELLEKSLQLNRLGDKCSKADRIYDPVCGRNLDAVVNCVIRGKMIWVLNAAGEVERSILAGARPCNAVCKQWLQGSCSKNQDCNNHHRVPQVYWARTTWRTVLAFQSMRIKVKEDTRIPNFWENEECVWPCGDNKHVLPLLSKDQDQNPNKRNPPKNPGPTAGSPHFLIKNHTGTEEKKPELKYSATKGWKKGQKGKGKGKNPRGKA